MKLRRLAFTLLAAGMLVMSGAVAASGPESVSATGRCELVGGEWVC